MANGLFTPLQLTAAYGIGTNTAFAIPSSLNAAYSAYNSAVTEINTAIYDVTHSSWADSTTKTNIQNITGNSGECPALGSAQPVIYSLNDYYTTRTYPGFAGYLQTLSDLYIGGVASPDESKFCQAFMAAVAYCTSLSKLINSAANAQTYLGPTFPGNNALITNSISNVNPDSGNFSKDLSMQGQLTNFADINLYGTPAGLLRQVSNLANINSGTLKVISDQLTLAGLTTVNIRELINRPATMSDNQFNQLQMVAYQGMTQVTGDDLQQVLSILEVTTPNINTMADLLNQQKIFPNSYSTLQTPTAEGYIPVYQNDAVNPSITPNVVAVTGCEELGKVMPPEQAVSSKSVQSSLQQITGITNTTLPKLADVVSNLSTLAGLPLIQNQTAVLDPSVVSYYTSISTGTGANNSITVSDVMGSVWGCVVTDALNAATQAIVSIPSSAKTSLVTLYQQMSSVSAGSYGDPATGPVVIPSGPAVGTYSDGNAALAALIAAANSAISSIASSYTAQCNTANTNFNLISTQMWYESQYQAAAGIAFADYPSNNQPTINAFVQNLPTYGTMTEPNGPAYFLNQLATLDTLGGQAVVGTMRDGVNAVTLGAAGLRLDIKPSAEPEDPPAPAVTPVY